MYIYIYIDEVRLAPIKRGFGQNVIFFRWRRAISRGYDVMRIFFCRACTMGELKNKLPSLALSAQGVKPL